MTSMSKHIIEIPHIETLPEQIISLYRNVAPLYDAEIRKLQPTCDVRSYHINLTHNLTMAWVAYMAKIIGDEIGVEAVFQPNDINHYRPGTGTHYAPLHAAIFHALAFAVLPDFNLMYPPELFEQIWHTHIAHQLVAHDVDPIDIPTTTQRWAHEYANVIRESMLAEKSALEKQQSPHQSERRAKHSRRNRRRLS